MLVFSVLSFVNCCSMKEIALKELRQLSDIPAQESFNKILKSYLTAPACMKKLQLGLFLAWNSLIGVWVFYTHLYAVFVSHKDLIEQNYGKTLNTLR